MPSGCSGRCVKVQIRHESLSCRWRWRATSQWWVTPVSKVPRMSSTYVELHFLSRNELYWGEKVQNQWGNDTSYMLIQSGLPPQFWLDAYMAARYILIQHDTNVDGSFLESRIEHITSYLKKRGEEEGDFLSTYSCNMCSILNTVKRIQIYL